MRRLSRDHLSLSKSGSTQEQIGIKRTSHQSMCLYPFFFFSEMNYEIVMFSNGNRKSKFIDGLYFWMAISKMIPTFIDVCLNLFDCWTSLVSSPFSQVLVRNGHFKDAHVGPMFTRIFRCHAGQRTLVVGQRTGCRNGRPEFIQKISSTNR